MTDNTVESGKTYRYRVRSVKEDGKKGPMNDKVDVTVP